MKVFQASPDFFAVEGSWWHVLHTVRAVVIFVYFSKACLIICIKVSLNITKDLAHQSFFSHYTLFIQLILMLIILKPFLIFLFSSFEETKEMERVYNE